MLGDSGFGKNWDTRTMARSENPGGGACSTMVDIFCPHGWDRQKLGYSMKKVW